MRAVVDKVLASGGWFWIEQWARDVPRGAQTPSNQSSTEVTNIHQIRLLAAQTPKAAYSFRLKGMSAG